MNKNEFTIDPVIEAKLKQLPCPKCGVAGALASKWVHLKMKHNNATIEAEGEGSVCIREDGGCGHIHMSDELTESIANQIAVAQGGPLKYIELNRETGEMKGHNVH